MSDAKQYDAESNMNQQEDDANDTEITLEMLNDLYESLLEEEKERKKQEDEEACNMIDAPIALARDLYQKGEVQKANEIARSVLNQDFSRYDGNWSTVAIVALIAQYYLWIGDYREADRLYHKYEKQIEKFEWEEPVLRMLVDLACEWEAHDMKRAVAYIDKAYEQYQRIENQEDLPFFTIVILHYNYAIFHLNQNRQEKKYVQQLKEVLVMLENQGMQDTSLATLEIKALYMYLIYAVEGTQYRGHIRHIKRYYGLSVAYEQELGRDRIVHRKFSCHCMGIYYLQIGNYRLSRHYIQEGLDILCEEENDMCALVDWWMESNLCALSYFDGSIFALRDLFKSHYDAICNKTIPKLVTEYDKYLEVARWAELLHYEEKFEDAIEAICRPFEQNILSVSVESSNFILLFSKLLQLVPQRKQELSFWKLHKYIKIIRQIETADSFYTVDHAIKVQFIAFKTNFLKKYKNKNEIASVRPMVEICLQDIDCAMGPYSGALLALISLALEDERREDAIYYLQKLQQGWRKQLKRGVFYKNREALLKYLNETSFIFDSIYSVVQKFEMITLEEKYNLVLDYKNSFSLLTFLRNCYVTEIDYLRKLQQEIDELDDEMSISKTEEWLFETEEGSEEKQRLLQVLEEKESAFAAEMEAHLDEIELLEYSFGEMCKYMPDNSVFLEYVPYIEEGYQVTVNGRYMNAEYRADHIKLTLYCIKKQNGSCIIRQAELMEYRKIEIVLEKFREISRDVKSRVTDVMLPFTFQKQRQEAECKRLEEMHVLQKKMYEYLIAPIEADLAGANIVYIAPDEHLLQNFSFDMLCDSEENLFGMKYPLVRLTSGRDFFRKAKLMQNNQSLVVGNPAYVIGDLSLGNEEEEFKTIFTQLPLGELEARVVADQLGTKAYIGEEAKKSVISQLEVSKWAHFSTHGIFDFEQIEDGWFSSALLFAGAENYMYTGENDPVYGSGLLTADEISRLDLGHMELVVLSSCNSMTTGGNLGGLSSAFQAAGVKYVLSALWEVDDLASFIFMAQFYENLSIYTVPKALYATKKFLRQITAAEVLDFIKTQGRCHDIEQESVLKDVIEVFEQLNPEDKVYADPYYWAGFVCTQNNF